MQRFGFRRRGDEVEAVFAAAEAELLRELAEAVSGLVRSNDRADPVVARLFPDAHRDDPGIAADYRDLAEDDLRSAKIDGARSLAASVATGGTVTLGEEDAEQWLRALNDIRLMLGTRLGVTEDQDTEPEPGDPMWIYYWLTDLQGTLIEALGA